MGAVQTKEMHLHSERETGHPVQWAHWTPVLMCRWNAGPAGRECTSPLAVSIPTTQKQCLQVVLPHFALNPCCSCHFDIQKASVDGPSYLDLSEHGFHQELHLHRIKKCSQEGAACECRAGPGLCEICFCGSWKWTELSLYLRLPVYLLSLT